jgi:hypothetical protein
MRLDTRAKILALSRGETLGVIETGKILKKSGTRGEGDAGRLSD